MEPEKVLAVVAMIWLIASFLAMARSIRRGRELADMLAARHPQTWETLGRPRPGYFESARRTRFSRFVGHREFEQLGDEILAAQFEAYRKNEARIVLSAILSGSVLALLVLALRYFG
ncbi:MAG: hypothetical protein AMJ66_01025 [Betaproteobacteria bacterium SG8_40]|nr:MAG: hypothetical protein AMJ66_01025 [Betaproteobacteria bacterium SG8_40]